jgi:hypothetical protein
MRCAPLLLVLLASACGTPGAEVRPMEGDFAFLEFKLGS